MAIRIPTVTTTDDDTFNPSSTVVGTPVNSAEIDVLSNLLATFDRKLQDTSTKMGNLDARVAKLDERIEHSTVSWFTILGTLTAVLALISFNANLFKNVEDASTAVLFMVVMCVVCLLLICFPLLLLHMLQNKIAARTIKFLRRIVIVCAAFLFLLWFVSWLSWMKIHFEEDSGIILRARKETKVLPNVEDIEEQQMRLIEQTNSILERFPMTED